MASALPILLTVAVGAVVLGTSSAKKSGGGRRVTPGKVSQPSVPQWCKEPWDQQRIMQVLGAVNKAAAEMPDAGGDTDEYRRQTFEVTKLVLGQVCGGIDLPPEYFNLGGYYETKPQWWRDLWDRVSVMAWNALVGPVDPY